MQEIFENIIKRLEEQKSGLTDWAEDNAFEIGIENAIEIVKQEAEEYNNGWIPVEQQLPETDDYILLSFENFTVADIGRYEVDKDGNGAFYPGDEDKSYVSFGLFVNAWKLLPKPYRKEDESNDSDKA